MEITLKSNASALTRFMAHVEVTESCWIWNGSRNQDGYGQFWINGRLRSAHRFAYGVLVGEIPEGMELHHSCERKECVNPHHLKLTTRSEHMGWHNKVTTKVNTTGRTRYVSKRRCSVEGCSRNVDSNELCEVHRRRFKKHGNVNADIPVGCMLKTEYLERVISDN